MLNLFIGLFLLCASLGVGISKTTKDYGVKKQREHKEPLTLD
jgi:hypothetical protein